MIPGWIVRGGRSCSILIYLQAQLKGEDISRVELIRSREQFRAAYQHVMEGKESLFFIEAAAGGGKSFFLRALKQGIEATGNLRKRINLK